MMIKYPRPLRSVTTPFIPPEIVAKDLTVFDAYTTTVDYQFELKNSSFTPSACYVEIGDEAGDDKEVS